jgi:hypothetical protein
MSFDVFKNYDWRVNMKVKTIKVALGCCLAIMLCVGQADADLLFSNGPINDPDSGGSCDSGPDSCGGSGTWTYYDNFELTANSIITGFDYTDWFFNGTPNDYFETNWSIFSSDPFNSAPDFAGTATAVLSATGPADQYLFTIDGLGLNLDAGIYWLGINNLNTSGIITTVATSDGVLPGAKQADGVSNFFDGVQERAFSVYGKSVPEPTSATILGFVAVGMFVRRRR